MLYLKEGNEIKKATVTIQFDQEKLKAIQFYISKTDTTMDEVLGVFLEKLYKKNVPAQTREYIESMAEPEEISRPRPASRPTVSGQPGE